MSDDKLLNSLTGPEESQGVMNALQTGATRRDLLGLLAAGGMQLALAGGLATTAMGAHAAAPAAKRGGKLRVACETASAADTLDPAKQSNQTDYCRGRMLYNGLFDLDGHLTPRPQLAESYSTKDAKTWIFKLRKGVTFHDGKPFTPADVVFSLTRHKDPAVASKAKALADAFESVKATGPNEVTVVLAEANADLPAMLGTFNFAIVKDGTTDFNAGIGTGPFKLQEFKPGVRSVVVRNPSYWKPGLPYLDEIELVGIGDENARVNALLSGSMDLVASISPYSVERVRKTPGYAALVTQSGQYTDLIMRMDMAPGNRADFVMGMKYLLNRDQMKTTITHGFSVVANDHPIPPYNRFFAKGLPQRKFDLDKAKFYLKKSGVTGRIPVVASPAATYSVEMALLMQQTAARAGLMLDVKRMPADGYWSNYWMQSAVGMGNINGRPTADITLTQFFKSDAQWNESRWKNPHFDQVLLAARAETNDAKRAQMYADLQTMIHEGAGVGIPLFLNSLDGYSAKVKGLSPIPVGGLMGYSFAENVWLA
jgi:peptide/nickel transport system substrate-binding protein